MIDFVALMREHGMPEAKIEKVKAARERKIKEREFALVSHSGMIDLPSQRPNEKEHD